MGSAAGGVGGGAADLVEGGFGRGRGRWRGLRLGRGGADARLQLQLRRRGGERALQRGMCAHPHGGGATGHGGAHRAVHGGVQRHGGLGLQRQPRGVLALGQLQAADVQAVLLPVKAVVAGQAPGFHGRGACPLQLVHAERHTDVQGQYQLGQGRGRLCAGRAGQRRDLHARGMHFAQLQAALQQGGQLPAQADVGHLDGQAWAAPAQPANAPAAAQRPSDLAALQLLVGGQVLRRARQRQGQRCVAASPPPHGSGCGNQQRNHCHQQPAQCTQHTAATARRRARATLVAGRRPCAEVRGAGAGCRGVGGHGLTVHQKLNPSRRCSRTSLVFTP